MLFIVVFTDHYHLVEAVRFELTVPFNTTVFKTVAINQTRPRFLLVGAQDRTQTCMIRICNPLRNHSATCAYTSNTLFGMCVLKHSKILRLPVLKECFNTI